MSFSSESSSGWDESTSSDQDKYKCHIKSDTIIGDNFKTIAQLGQGSFGSIYLGHTLDMNKTKVAIKFEPMKEWTSTQLYNERRIYQLIGHREGFPQMFWFGQHSNYNVIVIELLGQNLEDVFQLCGNKFSLKTILYLVLQLLNRFEYIHSINICYRDVKPENFLLGYPGTTNRNIVHVVDFGLSKEYIDTATGQHIAFKEGKNLTGTARYMSINAHLGIEQSRRDDLEALAHMFIYFLREGKLPWSGLHARTAKERYSKIRICKQETKLDLLCHGFPMEFADFLEYCRNLQFDQQPNYGRWKTKFDHLLKQQQNQNDDKTMTKLDWEDKITR